MREISLGYIINSLLWFVLIFCALTINNSDGVDLLDALIKNAHGG